MKYIHNIRFGFATNSSSSHSVVLFNKPHNLKEYFPDQEFGWGDFVLTSEHAKRVYLAQQLSNQIAKMHNLSCADATLIAAKWSGLDSLDPEGFVDHQSQISFPYETVFGKIEVNKEFYNDLINYVVQPNVVIFGGNDNEPNEDVLRIKLRPSVKDVTENIIAGTLNGQTLARYDETGKFWSLFNYETGTKIRTSFHEDANVEKSEVPELVDLKITQYCESNCSFCYQGSNTKGKHADVDDIKTIIRGLANLKVFEIALGGGEPTQHPKFVEIVRNAASHNVKPNFSTRNIQWVIDNYSKIEGSVGAIGISIDTEYGLTDLLCKLRTLPKLKFMLQVAVGSCSELELMDILQTANTFHVPVLLLGWKYNNKGKNGPQFEVNLEKVLNGFYYGEKYWRGPDISFDSCLVNQHLDWLNEHSNEYFFTKKEGAHSMYIDAVNSKMAQSSFVQPKEMKDLEISNHCDKDIKEFFATI
jgi:uncharacterized protein YggL (DUF469 family)